MALARIRKGDLVEVIAGKERGKRGKVLRVDPSRERVYVEKLNMIKRHMRPTRQHPQGGILEREGPIHLSNVMLVCPKCDRPTRVGTRIQEQEKFRYCKRCGEVIEV